MKIYRPMCKTVNERQDTAKQNEKQERSGSYDKDKKDIREQPEKQRSKRAQDL
ncbi:hypothetical protein [Ruminococcus sp.]|uniref:hypothetical protein n=1 Tax=Ruminococcus sp. TaxID=41978 RepID=UPI0025911458|nr:hypothetical protein [Ruminococcus sp.]